MNALAVAADEALEATVVGSFSRLGYEVRRRTAHWTDPPAMDGKVVLITGATSGLGLATATRLARMGASIRFLARDPRRAAAAATAIVEASGNTDVSHGIADLSDLGALRAFAATFRAEEPRLDVLIHNAGALSRRYQTSADGTELTVATQLVAPFVLTSELVGLLSSSATSRVITVSSGGMYTQRYNLDQLEMGPNTYDGVTAYARAKRAQVVLSREWARRHTGCGIVFHAMHPGWADTPGVQTSLPAFRRVMRPLLRNADQGSDTIVWLAASTEAARCSGRFWHDRRPRLEHKLPWTRPAGPALEGERLWDWCTRRAARGSWPDTSC
jgi:dehydrogenase/reductase SDR family member 12